MSFICNSMDQENYESFPSLRSQENHVLLADRTGDSLKVLWSSREGGMRDAACSISGPTRTATAPPITSHSRRTVIVIIIIIPADIRVT